MIGIKVLDYELTETSSPNSKLEYTLNDILDNKLECVFQKIYRLVFQNNTANEKFIDELFKKIVTKLYTDRNSYDSGYKSEITETMTEQERFMEGYQQYAVFDY